MVPALWSVMSWAEKAQAPVTIRDTDIIFEQNTLIVRALSGWSSALESFSPSVCVEERFVLLSNRNDKQRVKTGSQALITTVVLEKWINARGRVSLAACFYCKYTN